MNIITMDGNLKGLSTSSGNDSIHTTSFYKCGV